MKHRIRATSAFLGAILALATSARAAVTIQNFTNVAPGGGLAGTPHDPLLAGSPDLIAASATDLLTGLAPTVTYTGGSGNTQYEDSRGESAWNDGSITTVYGGVPNAVAHLAYGVAVATVGGSDIDAFVTYDLGALYHLSQIDVILGWNDSGRDESSFNVLVADESMTFTLLASYLKGTDDTGVIGTPVTNLHRFIDDGGGDVAGNVRYVQFQFTDADNGAAGIAEIDVFGTAVPEPSALVIAGLGLASAGLRRRR
ncbi:PEP-CTERM sorting domain-containing protein [Haloferula sargassicola]|uniref:Ice-binding protein C-terminal domain-containing protein n=1 Tax=Haloferula sargassicola TaxID=490096 RepID=A0ABP9UNV1_9BACT